METGYLNCYDEEHFSTLSPSMMYDDQGDMLEDSESSLLDMIPVDFYGSRLARSDPWGQDHEQELNGDIALLPGPVNSTHHHHRLEDYHKTLNDWQEHIGSLQNSDHDEMEIKGIFDEMDVVLTSYSADGSHDGMFDESSFDADNAHKKLDKSATKTTTSLGIVKNLTGKDLPLGTFIKEEADDIDDFEVAEEEGFLTNKFEMNTLALEESNNLEDDFRIEGDDDCIDVETVASSEQMPVLEAGDLSSLLEQFEASETVNSTTNMSRKHVTERQTSGVPKFKQVPKVVTTLPPKPVNMTHQNIRDALPKEVIDRIKASGRKKTISVIPAIPTKRTGRGGTRMQDAGVALIRNKLLKIVSGSVSGESIQLDHDYCTASKKQSSETGSVPPRSFYHSNASEYSSQDKNKLPLNEKVYSRLPDYYVALAKQSTLSASGDDSRRDSGLESGDTSDTSEESSDKSSSVVCSRTGNKLGALNSDSSVLPTKTADKIITICGKTHNVGSIMETWNKTLAKSQSGPQSSLLKQPMVSVLKKTPLIELVDVSKDVDMRNIDMKSNDDEKDTKKRRKLNILEYRSRIKELDRSAGSCDTTRSNSPLTPELGTAEEAQQLFDQATKMLMNCNGQIDVQTSAIITQTLKEQAALTMPKHMVQEIKHTIHEKTIWVPPEEITLVEMALEDEAVAIETVEPPTSQAEAVNVEPKTVTEVTEEETADSPSSNIISGMNHDRSRRQYRSRRVDSSSSSSPNPDRQCSNESPETMQSDKRRSDWSPESTRSNKRRYVPPELCKGEKRQSVDRSSENTAAKKRQSDMHSERFNRDRRHSDRSSERSRPNKRKSDRSPEDAGHDKRRSEWSPRRHRTASRSPSSSRSSCSSYSSQSRSSSRNRSRDWQGDRSSRIDYDRNRRSESIHSHRSYRSNTSSRTWRRSRSPPPVHSRSPTVQFSMEEKQRQVEERRVIYVGQIEETMSKAKLRELFEAFGPIVDISVHFREHGDNYGFVTYARKDDAYKAVETGKRDPTVNRYELSFGGRRAFCKTRYSDLDGQRDDDDPIVAYMPLRAPLPPRPKLQPDDFDLLMKEAQARLLKRKA